MQTSLQSFKSSQKVNILDGTTETIHESMQKCGQCDRGPSKPEETILFATKRRWDLHLKS